MEDLVGEDNLHFVLYPLHSTISTSLLNTNFLQIPTHRIAYSMIAPWKNLKQALSSKRKSRKFAACKEVFEPRNYYYVGPTCISTSCDIFPRRMGVKATAPPHWSEIQAVVRDCAAKFLMVSLNCVACDPLAHLFPTGYRKQSTGKLSLVAKTGWELTSFSSLQYLIGYDTVMMSLPSEALNEFLLYLERCFVSIHVSNAPSPSSLTLPSTGRRRIPSNGRRPHTHEECRNIPRPRLPRNAMGVRLQTCPLRGPAYPPVSKQCWLAMMTRTGVTESRICSSVSYDER